MEKKSRIIAGDVTVGTLGVKIICANRVSAGLSYDVILNGIYQYVRKYAVLNKNICHFLGPSPSAFRKKIQNMGTYTN